MVKIKEGVNKLALDELVRLYDRLTSLYDGIKLKIFALLAGEVAIVPFVFSNNFPELNTLSDALFFSAGAVLLALSFGLLLFAISTADWMVPFDVRESRLAPKRYGSDEEFLEYLKADYEDCIVDCLKRIKLRARIFNITLMVFIASIAVLFVIKYA